MWIRHKSVNDGFNFVLIVLSLGASFRALLSITFSIIISIIIVLLLLLLLLLLFCF